MACMSWECCDSACGTVVCNNERGPQYCPTCGTSMLGTFDEDPSDEEDFEYGGLCDEPDDDDTRDEDGD